MKTRIIVAAIGLPLLLVIVLVLPSLATAILVAAMSAIAAYELLYRCGILKHTRILVYSMIAAVGVSIWSWMYAALPAVSRAFGMTVVLLFIAALFCEMLAAHTDLKFRSVCAAIFAGLVIPYMLGALVRLRCMQDGQFYILVAFLLTMVADSGAYFVGRAVGKRKLAPIISPNKTVEGAIGGAVANVITMLLYSLILQFAFKFQVNYLFAILYGIIGAGGSMLGDLGFSVIKRQVKIKDYGTLLPGHGGILDRFDSTLIVAPLTEVLMLLIPFAAK